MRDQITEFHRRLQAQQEAHKERSLWLRTAGVFVGIGLLPLGVVLIPLPGPGIGIIALGLAILSLEFHWPRKALDKIMPLIAGRPKPGQPELPPPAPPARAQAALSAPAQLAKQVSDPLTQRAEPPQHGEDRDDP